MASHCGDKFLTDTDVVENLKYKHEEKQKVNQSYFTTFVFTADL